MIFLTDTDISVSVYISIGLSLAGAEMSGVFISGKVNLMSYRVGGLFTKQAESELDI